MNNLHPVQNIKLPPHSIEAEQSVLGSLMLIGKPESFVFDTLESNHFFTNEHAVIFEALLNLSLDKQPLDAITVVEKLESMGTIDSAGGMSYIVELVNNTPSAANLKAYVHIVKDRAKLRRLILVCGNVSDQAFFPHGKKSSHIIEAAQEEFFKFFKSDDDLEQDFSIQQTLESAIEQLQYRYENDGITGLETGFSVLDENVYGLQPGEFYVVAGRPAMGKTTFGLNIIENVIKQGKKALFFSLEMPKERVIDKMLSSMSGVDFKRIKEGSLLDADWGVIAQATDQLRQSNLIIDDQAGQAMGTIRAKCMKHNARGQLSLVMIDYLQLVHGKGNSRTEEIGMVSQACKELSKELSCPVVALAQLSRKVEERADKRPMVSDLRDSGQIEQDADAIFFLYRDEVYYPDNPLNRGITEILTGKARFGELGKALIGSDLARSRFLNLTNVPNYEAHTAQKKGGGGFNRENKSNS